MSLLGVSYRAIAEIFSIFHEMSGCFLWGETTCPSYTTHRSWSLRFSLNALTSPKNLQGDVCLMLDHTIKSGSLKCLIGMAVSLDKLRDRNDFTVTYNDLTPLIIEPIKSSSGDLVNKSIAQAANNAGLDYFTQIQKDNAPDLARAGKLYIGDNKKTINSTDITHMKGILLKKHFSKQSLFLSYTKQVTHTKQTLKQNEYSILAPPHQRKKGRFLNADIVINYGIKIFKFKNTAAAKKVPSKELFKVEWLDDYGEWLLESKNAITVCEIAESQVIKEGYHGESAKDYRRKINCMELSKECEAIAREMERHLMKEGKGIPRNKAILGCTNALESLIGKCKALDAGPSSKDFTARALLHAGVVCRPTPETVKIALKGTTCTDVHQWERRYLGKSINSIRKILFPRSSKNAI